MNVCGAVLNAVDTACNQSHTVCVPSPKRRAIRDRALKATVKAVVQVKVVI